MAANKIIIGFVLPARQELQHQKSKNLAGRKFEVWILLFFYNIWNIAKKNHSIFLLINNKNLSLLRFIIIII